MQSICFAADLHKFASRSDADRVEPELRRVIATSDRCVLGGDIFDFRWSILPSAAETAEAAVDWTRNLARDFPAVQFHLLLGNHDHSDELIRRLPALQDELPNFEWHTYYLRVGPAVFLHGDAADVRRQAQTAGGQARLVHRRGKCLHHGARPRRRASHHVYRQFVRTRLHHLVPKVAYPRRRVVRRLAAYLEHLNCAAADGVRDVYFGHTHSRVDGHRYAGLTFHNGGAPIASRSFRILTAELPADAPVHGH